MLIRDMIREDVPALLTILGATGLFPPEMLPAMAEPALVAPGGTTFWLVAVTDADAVGFAYVEPERMTSGTYNLLAIAVRPDKQGASVGRQLVQNVERRVADNGGRVLLVETSTLDGYAKTRRFYARQGYETEATVRDFYAEGEGKVVFRKKLA